MKVRRSGRSGRAGRSSVLRNMLTTLSVLSASPAVAQVSSDTVIDRAARAYQQLTSFQADFRQVIADSMIGTFESKGRLLQAGTASFAMRFTDPNGEAIVMDGEYVWIYTPSTTPGQVIRTPVPKDATYGPNILAWLLTNPVERYQTRYIREDAVGGRSADVIELTPLDPSLPFRNAILWIDRSDNLPRRLEIQEKTGTNRTLVLSGVVINRRPPQNAFTFNVPSGVRVIEQ
ncbi:MAG TPA: outer membrane lipoprotein carrier protein LolA [Gemmatimonadales bacterium]|nr:outer membrane lipoprotein carrier protein LolA [Gemmatimonadales bacterium]